MIYRKPPFEKERLKAKVIWFFLQEQNYFTHFQRGLWPGKSNTLFFIEQLRLLIVYKENRKTSFFLERKLKAGTFDFIGANINLSAFNEVSDQELYGNNIFWV